MFFCTGRRWTNFWGSHWPSPKYCLPGLSISKDDGNEVIKPLYKKLLPKLGVVGDLPLPYRYGSQKYFGFGLTDIYIDHIMAKINIYSVHFPTSTLLEQQLQHVSEKLQLEVSVDTPFSHLPYIQYGTYTTPCWLGHLWQEISDQPVRIEFRKQPVMGLQRVGDEYIMKKIIQLNKYNRSKLMSINNVRLALQCYSLADILDGSGIHLWRILF